LGEDRRDADLLAVAFDGGRITATRHAVSRCAAGVGLTGWRLEGFVFAVNEIVTNAVRHGGGAGSLRMWSADGSLWVEISDRGPGAPPDRLAPTALPSSKATGGRGLWLARYFSDEYTVRTGPGGTSIRLALAVRE
jgi:serine/threonine-protein kinase RsbW